MNISRNLMLASLMFSTLLFAEVQLPEAVVRANLAAFNRHEVDALAATVAEDFIWYNVDGDKVSVESKGREALRKGMTDYFKSLPSARSAAESLVVNGVFVNVKERASWKNKAGDLKSQAALAIYEVREGLIKRVWYFPAQK